MVTGGLAQHYRNQRDDLALLVVTVGLITDDDIDKYNRKKNL